MASQQAFRRNKDLTSGADVTMIMLLSVECVIESIV